MKLSIFVLLALSGAPLLFAQTTASRAGQASTGQSQPAQTQGASSPRGPEAVAQQDPNRVVATIDGQPITAAQAEGMLKQIPQNQRQTNGNLDQLLERLYMVDHFSERALQAGLENQAPWKQDLEFTREQILAQAYLQHLTTSDAQAIQSAQQYYNAHPEEFEQVHLDGILVAFAPPGTPQAAGKTVRTEEEARAKAEDLEKKLRAGSDFSALARTDSDNTQSAERGGDLGTLNINAPTIPSTIRSAVASLQPGQISQPVQVQGGFYIFKLLSRDKLPFDQVKAQIIVKQVYDRYKVEVKDPAFFNESTTPSLANPRRGAASGTGAAGRTPGAPAASHR
jgi:parvulin-like peptidyl-prolyl isomerase